MALPHHRTPTPGVCASEQFSSDARFQALFEQAPTSMQLLAADGTTLRVNRAWRTLWDIPNSSALSDYVLSGEYNVLMDPQLHDNGITPYLQRAFAGESVRIPATNYDPAALGKPGCTRWVTAIAHPLKDEQGRVHEVMLMHEDITEQVEAERRLRDSEERFRSLVTATSTMVWTMTAEGLARDDSPSWRAFTGQTEQEWKAKGWSAAVHPDDRAHALQTFRECIGKRSIYESEYRLRRADGQYRW
ncbi:MAG: PAS domain-containing protein, partial [Burkholderiaceae bacterium]